MNPRLWIRDPLSHGLGSGSEGHVDSFTDRLYIRRYSREPRLKKLLIRRMSFDDYDLGHPISSYELLFKSLDFSLRIKLIMSKPFFSFISFSNSTTLCHFSNSTQ